VCAKDYGLNKKKNTCRQTQTHAIKLKRTPAMGLGLECMVVNYQVKWFGQSQRRQKLAVWFFSV
jgi:hypothetical protein